MDVRCGTSGFAYAPWRGRFYPSDLPRDRMLAFYAERFGTVEVNATFHRTPSPETVAGWGAQAPASFRFALKAPQRITHGQRLAGAGGAVAWFLRSAAELGAKLGPILFQLPPTLRKDLPRLAAFLELLPAGTRAAFEFRDRSWLGDDVLALLRDRGAALCVADSETLETPLVATATWGYLRLRRAEYSAPELRAWAERIAVQPWREAFVFFKHEDEARGPRLAQAMAALLGAGQRVAAAESPHVP